MSRLTNRKLNKMISDYTSNIAVPDVKDKAKSAPITVCNTSKSSVPKKAIVTAFVCCLIIVCTCLGVLLPVDNGTTLPQNNNPTTPVVNKVSYITVDINPSFTLELNNNTVISVVNNNYDGAIVLSGIDVSNIVGKNYNDAINELLDESAKIGYIDYSSVEEQKLRNVVKVAVFSDDEVDLDSLVNSAETAVKDYFVNKNLFAVVIKDSVLKERNDKIMEQYGITASKYDLIKAAYIVKNSVIEVNERDRNFINFVNENKDTRISELYNIVYSYKNESLTKVYKTINDAIKDEQGFNDYVASVTAKNNELEEFISAKLTDLEKNLKSAKDKMDKYLSTKISESKEIIKNAVSIIVEDIKSRNEVDMKQVLQDIDNIHKWLSDNIKKSIGIDIDLLIMD